MDGLASSSGPTLEEEIMLLVGGFLEEHGHRQLAQLVNKRSKLSFDAELVKKYVLEGQWFEVEDYIRTWIPAPEDLSAQHQSRDTSLKIFRFLRRRRFLEALFQGDIKSCHKMVTSGELRAAVDETSYAECLRWFETADPFNSEPKLKDFPSCSKPKWQEVPPGGNKPHWETCFDAIMKLLQPVLANARTATPPSPTPGLLRQMIVAGMKANNVTTLLGSAPPASFLRLPAAATTPTAAPVSQKRPVEHPLSTPSAAPSPTSAIATPSAKKPRAEAAQSISPPPPPTPVAATPSPVPKPKVPPAPVSAPLTPTTPAAADLTKAKPSPMAVTPTKPPAANGTPTPAATTPTPAPAPAPAGLNIAQVVGHPMKMVDVLPLRLWARKAMPSQVRCISSLPFKAEWLICGDDLGVLTIVKALTAEVIGSFPRPAGESTALTRIFVDEIHKTRWIALVYEKSKNVYLCQVTPDSPYITLITKVVAPADVVTVIFMQFIRSVSTRDVEMLIFSKSATVVHFDLDKKTLKQRPIPDLEGTILSASEVVKPDFLTHLCLLTTEEHIIAYKREAELWSRVTDPTQNRHKVESFFSTSTTQCRGYTSGGAEARLLHLHVDVKTIRVEYKGFTATASCWPRAKTFVAGIPPEGVAPTYVVAADANTIQFWEEPTEELKKKTDEHRPPFQQERVTHLGFPAGVQVAAFAVPPTGNWLAVSLNHDESVHIYLPRKEYHEAISQTAREKVARDPTLPSIATPRATPLQVSKAAELAVPQFSLGSPAVAAPALSSSSGGGGGGGGSSSGSLTSSAGATKGPRLRFHSRIADPSLTQPAVFLNTSRTGLAVSLHTDTKMILWSVQNPPKILLRNNSSKIRGDIAADGSAVVYLGDNCVILARINADRSSFEGGKLIFTPAEAAKKPPTWVSFAKDAPLRALIGCADGSLLVYDTESRADPLVATPVPNHIHAGAVICADARMNMTVSAAEDGFLLVSLKGDDRVRRVKLSGFQPSSLSGTLPSVNTKPSVQIQIHNNGEAVLVCLPDRLQIYKPLKTLKAIEEQSPPGQKITAAKYLSDCSYIVCAYSNKKIALLDPELGGEVCSAVLDSSSGSGASASGQSLAHGSESGGGGGGALFVGASTGAIYRFEIDGLATK